jgi:hypothetical protein
MTMTALTAQLMQIAQPKTQADKFAVVSFAIANMVKMGIPLDRALDAVLGDGTFAEIAADVYTALRGEG